MTKSRFMVCYIGVGSNLGDRRAYITKAIALLKATHGVRVKMVSPVYETKPQGGPKGQPDFLNLVIRADCAMPPGKLLLILKNVERRAGRKERRKRWAAREIDLDILLCDGLIIDKNILKVPHPRMKERYFVLRPLCDIAPRLKDPVSGEKFSEILSMLQQGRKGLKLAEPDKRRMA